MTGFAIKANEPITKQEATSRTSAIEIRDEEWFKKQLQERGVGALEIAWGDYIPHFREIPPHLLDQYLAYRLRLLHRTALDMVMAEDDRIKTHPATL